jgi:hypothetical protein
LNIIGNIQYRDIENGANVKVIIYKNLKKEEGVYLLCGIIHFGTSYNSLAFLADKSAASTYARVVAAGFWTLNINTILVMVSIVIGIFNRNRLIDLYWWCKKVEEI